MLPEGVGILPDGSAGAWIEPRLGGEFGAVTLQVPCGYDAYARILHPVRGREREYRWAEVAEATGRTMHPEVQWQSLVEPERYGGPGTLWDGGEPWTGGTELAPERLRALADLLVPHTSTPKRCFFAIWEGHGSKFTEALNLRGCSKLTLPGRKYLLFTGPLPALADFLEQSGEGADMIFPADSPQMIWPNDRAWFVASEIDFDSTLIGGPKTLIEAVLAHPAFEAFEVQPDSSLAVDGDQINPYPRYHELEEP